MNWIQRIAAKYVVEYVFGFLERRFGMSGWKTWAGGIGIILTGLAVIANCVATGDYTHLTEGVLSVLAGLATLGIGHKIEKSNPQ